VHWSNNDLVQVSSLYLSILSYNLHHEQLSLLNQPVITSILVPTFSDQTHLTLRGDYRPLPELD